MAAAVLARIRRGGRAAGRLAPAVPGWPSKARNLLTSVSTLGYATLVEGRCKRFVATRSPVLPPSDSLCWRMEGPGPRVMDTLQFRVPFPTLQCDSSSSQARVLQPLFRCLWPLPDRPRALERNHLSGLSPQDCFLGPQSLSSSSPTLLGDLGAHPLAPPPSPLRVLP